jgi:hypothetical protein
MNPAITSDKLGSTLSRPRTPASLRTGCGPQHLVLAIFARSMLQCFERGIFAGLSVEALSARVLFRDIELARHWLYKLWPWDSLHTSEHFWYASAKQHRNKGKEQTSIQTPLRRHCLRTLASKPPREQPNTWRCGP